MTTFTRFEDIEAWKRARELTHKVYRYTKIRGFASDYALKDQIRRASVSVLSNIAEGYEREHSSTSPWTKAIFPKISSTS